MCYMFVLLRYSHIINSNFSLQFICDCIIILYLCIYKYLYQKMYIHFSYLHIEYRI